MAEEETVASCVFETAKRVTEKVYGNRVVIFVPIYYSNHCRNNCLYCGYRKDNKINRRRKSVEEFKEEIVSILNRGFAGIEIVRGEDPFYTA